MLFTRVDARPQSRLEAPGLNYLGDVDCMDRFVDGFVAGGRFTTGTIGFVA